MREAQILLEHGAPARAIALAVFALEELGKLPKLANFARYERQHRWPAFWKSFRSHVDKLDLHATSAAVLLSNDEEEVVSWLGRNLSLASLHELKMKALYVDWEDEGFRAPVDIRDSEEVARQVIHVANDSIEFHRERAGRQTKETLLRLQDRMATFEESTRDAKGPHDVLKAIYAEKDKRDHLPT